MDEPLLGYIGGTIDRAAAKRCDAAWLAGCLADPACRIVRFHRDRPRIVMAHNPGAAIAYDSPAGIARSDDSEPVFLGLDGASTPVFAVSAPAAEEDSEVKHIDLRSLATQGLLAPGDLNLLAHARTLLDWHERNRFCANCGAGTVLADGGYRRHCEACSANHFPRTDPVVILVAVNGSDCLLGRQPHFQPGVYSALAGFVEPGESLEEAARREILEEAGVKVGRIRYHSSQPWPFPANLMIGLLGEAETTEVIIDRTELEDAHWFGRDELRAMLEDRHPDGLKVPAPMAIAHHLIRAAVAD